MSLFARLFRRKSPEVRRALDPITGEPIPYAFPPRQRLEGNLTYIGLCITAAGAVAKLFGWDLPTEQAHGIVGWLSANWDDIAQLVGLLTSAYGRLRVNWRKPEPQP